MNVKNLLSWKRWLAYILGISAASPLYYVADSYGILPEYSVIESVGDSSLVVDAEIVSEENMDSTFRTSSMDGEQQTQYPRESYTVKRPAGKRVGCICMDDEKQEYTGGGACAGHGGVRFWLYQQADGTIIRHATQRHRDHPHALNSDDLSNLSAHQKRASTSPLEADYAATSRGANFYDTIIALMVCLTLAFIAKTLWEHDKLSS